MATRITPTLHAKGVYKLRSPWTASESVIYECIAIRSIPDFVDRGVDVLSKVYTPVGLGQTELNSDIADSAMIITLVAAGKAPIYVPDTYITAAPAADGIPFSHTVLSVSLGAIPDSLDLSFVISQVQSVVQASFGISPTVNQHVAPTTGYMSQAAAEAWETGRQAAITNTVTDASRVLELQNQNAALIQRQGELEAIIQQLSPP